VARELATAPVGTTPSVERLRGVLAQIDDSRRERTGFMGRLREWLERLFAPQSASEDAGRLGLLIDRATLSQRTIELIGAVALGVVVVLAVLILVNEARAAGILGRRPRDGRRGITSDPLRRPQLSWRDVERAAPAERLAVLLRLVAERLTALQRLPPSAGLTTRELLERAILADESDRVSLAHLAAAAERARYGAQPYRQDAQAAFEEGRRLFDRLQAWQAAPQ
jgi:hypothetical protein